MVIELSFFKDLMAKINSRTQTRIIKLRALIDDGPYKKP
jgi:hypothetical protein